MNDARGKSVSSIDRHIGARLRECRLARNLTEAELGSRAGLHPEDISAFESGSIRAAARELLILTKVLDVPVRRLFEAYDPGA